MKETWSALCYDETREREKEIKVNEKKSCWFPFFFSFSSSWFTPTRDVRAEDSNIPLLTLHSPLVVVVVVVVVNTTRRGDIKRFSLSSFEFKLWSGRTSERNKNALAECGSNWRPRPSLTCSSSNWLLSVPSLCVSFLYKRSSIIFFFFSIKPEITVNFHIKN